MLAVLLCTSAFGPAVVAGAGAATQTQDGSSTNSVRVTTGAQLSTLVTATSNEVRTEFENAAFEERLERNGSDDEARAAAIADRAATLEDRSAALQAEYEDATAAYEAGDIDESTYAQRLASLNARAQGVVSSYDRLLERADDVSADALDAANVSVAELREQRDEADRLTSTGTDALRRQFTGEAEGEAEIEIETGGISIEAETEDGERSREFERPRDGDGSLNVSQADAREAALDALSAVNGSWTLEEASSDADDGVYEFEFSLTGDATGEAEVSVDGETGTVFALEEEIEVPEADEEDEDDEDDGEKPDIDDEREDEDEDESENETERETDDEREDDDGDAALETDATVENGTVTVTVTQNGSAVSGADVVANDESVGTTGADGTVSFAAPDDAEELEIDVTDGDLEAELEIDLEGADRDAAEADEEQPDGDDGDDGDVDEDDEDDGEDSDDEDDESTDESAD
ncbi:hypothetical protein GCM10028856_23760 [Halopiger thermotolerans]